MNHFFVTCSLGVGKEGGGRLGGNKTRACGRLSITSQTCAALDTALMEQVMKDITFKNTFNKCKKKTKKTKKLTYMVDNIGSSDINRTGT